MPGFNTGKITSSVIFYDRGVPNRAKNFGLLASLNYEILKPLAIYNRRQQGRTYRPTYTLF